MCELIFYKILIEWTSKFTTVPGTLLVTVSRVLGCGKRIFFLWSLVVPLPSGAALNDTGDQWQSFGTAGVSLAKMKTVTKTEHMDPIPMASAAICAHCVWASNLQELRITMPK
jgi:hypothetical protein